MCMLWGVAATCTMSLRQTLVRYIPDVRRVRWCICVWHVYELCDREWHVNKEILRDNMYIKVWLRLIHVLSVTKGWHEFKVPLSADKCARCCLGLTSVGCYLGFRRLGCYLGLTRGLCHLELRRVILFYLGLSKLEFRVLWRGKTKSLHCEDA